MDGRLSLVVGAILEGKFGNLRETVSQCLETLTPKRDVYMVGHDFGAYLEANEVIDATYVDVQGESRLEMSRKCLGSIDPWIDLWFGGP